MPSDVLDYVRSKKPEFAQVPDDELTAYLGDRKPEFLQDPGFKQQFQEVSVKHGAQANTEILNTVVGTITNPAVGIASEEGKKQSTDEARAPFIQSPETQRKMQEMPLEFSEIGGGTLVKSGRHVKETEDLPLFNLVTPLTLEETERLRQTNPKQLGMIQSITENANQLTTTKNLLMIGGAASVGGVSKLASHLVALGFAAVTAKAVASTLGELGGEYAKPEGERDQTKIARLKTDATIGTAFTVLAGLHG